MTINNNTEALPRAHSPRRLRPAFAGALGKWLEKKHGLFALLSVVIVISDFMFIAINYEAGKRALNHEWEETWHRASATLELAIQEQSNSMLMLARGYAADPEIQQLFLAGREAVIAEGGGPGREKAADARQILYDRMAPSWNQITAEFRVRQLHFHLGPGSLSFLRVHRPERFGDRMDDLRHIIVDTIAEGTPRTGFETGRVYSGLRGVTPVMATQADGEQVIVGALEAGTSFETLMQLMEDALGAGVAVLLSREHVVNSMWDEFVAERFTENTGTCGCVLEARSRDEILTWFGSGQVIDASIQPVQLATLGERSYALMQFPLRDYLTEREPERAPIGRLVVWQDATERTAAFHTDQAINVAFSLMALVIIEILLFFSVRFVTRARDAAEAGAVAKSRFLATMSHEFRTPLNAVIGFAELLRSEIAGPLQDKQKGYVVDIESSGRHLLSNIDRILHYQKIEDEKCQTPKEPLDLAAHLRRIIEQWDEAAQAVGAEIVSSMPETLKVRLNVDALDQAFNEVLANAIEVSPNGGTVRVDLVQTRSGVRLAVCDDGPGFPEDKLELLAQPFSKWQNPNVAADGFGLGLAFVRVLVASQGGHLVVENQPDCGARIVMDFPRT